MRLDPYKGLGGIRARDAVADHVPIEVREDMRGFSTGRTVDRLYLQNTAVLECVVGRKMSIGIR